jgi:molecular chaperone DnaJ
VRSSYPGDLYCHVAIETPVKLTDPQKKLLRDFDASIQQGGSKHFPGTESWTDKLKSFFGVDA